MSTTPQLGLPLIAAAQAQKHVTHNEAIALLDALVHLAVKERNRTAAPGEPAPGDRYLVGSGATGVFAGRDGQVAVFDLGAWRFLTPRAGWQAFVEAEDRVVVHDGALWQDLERYGSSDQVERLGIGTPADALNRLAAKLNAALFTALDVADGGTGDLRVVLNKPSAGGVLSQLFQTAYGGRAEAGLIGDDDYRIRVSADGAEWRDAVRIDRASGEVSFPSGAQGVGSSGNLLINADFSVNQRAFGGGPLAAGTYGFDRWKGGPGGCTLTRSGDVVALNGALTQVIERPGLAGAVVTLSVDNPTAPLEVSIGGATGTIPSGTGRRFVTLTVPAASTGDVTVTMSGTGASFARPVLNRGSVPEPYLRPPAALAQLLCQRYFAKTFPPATPPAGGAGSAGALVSYSVVTNSIQVVRWQFPVAMRAVPTLTFFNPMAANALWSTGNVNAIAVGGTASPDSVRVGVASAPTIAAGSLTTIHAVADAEL